MLRDVELHGKGAAADVARRSPAPRRIDIGDADARALARIAFGDRPADAARAAGDDRDLALQPSLP